jgi:hypothetical protein
VRLRSDLIQRARDAAARRVAQDVNILACASQDTLHQPVKGRGVALERRLER